MRVFTCPAQYRAHVEAAVALIVAEVERDVRCREDEDARVRHLCPVSEDMIDPKETGVLLITIDIPNDELLGDDTRVLALTPHR